MSHDIFKKLLSQVSVIYRSYAREAEESGENFNIFRIIKFEAKERQVHSSFLAELLSSKGSHGQGDYFIKSFIEFLRSKKPGFAIYEFDTSRAKTQVEKYIGIKKEISGGYIDILISDKNKNQIIIENKIHHGDTPQQLLKYHLYNIKAPIMYLTLDGHSPDPISLTNGKQSVSEERLFLLSYHDEILEWLEKCAKDIKDHQPLKEIIKQYVNLIKYLTGQTMNDEMIKEIVKIIDDDPEYIEAAFAVSASLDKLKRKMIDDFLSKLNEDLKLLGLKFKNNPKFGIGSEEYIYFFKEGWTYTITFDFENPFAKLAIGMYRLDDEESTDKKLKNNVRACLSKLNIGEMLTDGESYENWIWLSTFEGFPDLGNDPKEWANLKDGERKDTLVNTIRKILEELEINGIRL
jgi:hypothetical protein